MSRVRLTLDGRSIEVDAGTTLLQVARAEGAKVPTLCHDDRLDPYGGCRMCLVDLKGAPRPVPACKTDCAEGMEVATSGEKLERVRRTMVDMLLADHYDDVGVKPNELQQLAVEFGLEKSSMAFDRRGAFEDRNRFIGFNPGACILCDRCVRYCDEVMQCSALEHAGQGAQATVQPTGGEGFLDTSCELCGGCVSTCPTGALYEKQATRGGVTTESDCQKTRTVCTYCGVGCVMDLNVCNGKVIKVTAEAGVGSNDGHLCTKGRFAFEFIHHSERLTHPLIRGADGELHQASWSQALDRVAQGLREVRKQYGPDSIGFLASSRCTNEDVYALQKLARAAVGTNNVHSCAAT
jgi:NADH-quinone oxidoreductase subunit G